MIDMRCYFTHPEYQNCVNIFKAKFTENKCDDYWSGFTALQQNVSNNKCPICEVELTNTPNKTHTATLDHFRPKDQDMYPNLKCKPENYILMCSLCNITYKKNDFPLLDILQKATNAKEVAETNNEQPLLFNPTEKNPLDFFELAFRQTAQGGILELKRKQGIPKDSYEYKICETMIKTFGLGYCESYPHPNDNAKVCRIEILTKHYNTFVEFAKEIKKQDQKSLALFLKDKNRIEELKKYGFFQFIVKKQFNYDSSIF
ncbi:MAG: hypothetical protein JXQ66_03765 [Campylobacterales bacterium]|nr:hypothetical protein [Campylobacterales bacterium]